MERRSEPELMDDEAQARAYAEADFSAPHSAFVELFLQRFGPLSAGATVADLGCGPADVTVRFASACRGCHVTGFDGAQAMLDYGRRRVQQAGLEHRVELRHGHFPQCLAEPLPRFDAVISNSLLHHLRAPEVIWQAVRRLARAGAPVFVMDLARPDDPESVERLVGLYAASAPAILQRDFRASLFAAYTPAEVAAQLGAAGLESFTVAAVSDRHLVACGRMPNDTAHEHGAP